MSAWVETDPAAFIRYADGVVLFHRVVNPPLPTLPFHADVPARVPKGRGR